MVTLLTHCLPSWIFIQRLATAQHISSKLGIAKMKHFLTDLRLLIFADVTILARNRCSACADFMREIILMVQVFVYELRWKL